VRFEVMRSRLDLIRFVGGPDEGLVFER
jgi:hypothetical protein